jgi:OmpA-OmpF porin, OOP family
MTHAFRPALVPSLLAALLGTAVLLPAKAADAPALEPVSVKAVARFGFDRTAINAEDEARILAEVGQMKDVTWQSVTATGHTDNIGPDTYNQQLSARRAQAVKRYLVGKGLKPAMIEAVGAGEEGPVAPNDDPAGRAMNRRTDIEFKGVRAAAK